MKTSSRLDTIITRQRKTLVRDIAFAVLVVFAGGVAVSSVTTAAHASAAATEGATGQIHVTAR